MAAIGNSATKTSTRPTLSCIRCAERKVKCDRQRPRCSACSKHNVDCNFNVSKPIPKKHKRIKVQVLADQLKRYEELMLKNGIILPDVVDDELLERPSHIQPMREDDHPIFSQPTGSERLVVNSSLSSHGHENLEFVENSLWRRVFEESNDSEIMLDHSDSSSESESAVDEHKFVLGIQPRMKAAHRLPPVDTMHQLWLAFVENFDPLTKIVHVPTLRPAFEKALSDVSQIPRNFEALMFAMLGAAVMTLKDGECQRRFNETRRSILLRFTKATEAALSRARFMATTSLVVLQALVIHLFSVRDMYEPRTVYTLTGIAVRIAQGIGLDRDGTVLGYSPFDSEIRRRVWWQLKSHDFRAAELCGLAKFRSLEPFSADSTKYPSNINDEDLHPNMATLEPRSSGLTDASFVAFKFEMTEFAAKRIAAFRHLGKDPSEWNLDTPDVDKAGTTIATSELKDKLEQKYLRHCDPSQPLHLLLSLVGRYGMNVITFLTHHPRRWASMEHVPLPEREFVWDCSVKLLEQYNMMLSNQFLERFYWHAPYFQQWQAFIYVLDTLRAEPLAAKSSQTWMLVGSIFENTPYLMSDMRKPIHVAISNLCLKAYDARENALLSSNASSQTPAFVVQLRQQREMAVGKQQARKSRQRTEPRAFESGLGSESNATPAVSVPFDRVEKSQLDLGQAFGIAESDSLRYFGFFENNHVANDTPVEFDFTLFETHPPGEATAYDAIDWEQWDSWLAESNLLPNSSQRLV